MEVSKESQIIKSYFDNEKFNHQSKHILLELYKCDFDKLNDESFLRCSLNKAAKLANAKVLNILIQMLILLNVEHVVSSFQSTYLQLLFYF